MVTNCPSCTAGDHMYIGSTCNCCGDPRPSSTKPVFQADAATARKQRPMYSGLIAYFPDALEEVSNVSFVGNVQHNGPDAPLHWAKEKSTDEPDALMRHLTDRARGSVYDTDGVRHLAKVAWRALANLQREIDKEKADDNV